MVSKTNDWIQEWQVRNQHRNSMLLEAVDAVLHDECFLEQGTHSNASNTAFILAFYLVNVFKEVKDLT